MASFACQAILYTLGQKNGRYAEWYVWEEDNNPNFMPISQQFDPAAQVREIPQHLPLSPTQFANYFSP
ncbi:MAG: hypothetical protein NW220_22115 [Leptolyngbyaceae cyanobacterium bins.349]|nr:hypothetical protein [Leptolyngbyaceae cyanobacterium bins.349]